MTETRKHLEQLVRHARLFVDCAKLPAEGVDSSGCIVIHDDTRGTTHHHCPRSRKDHEAPEPWRSRLFAQRTLVVSVPIRDTCQDP